MKNYLLILCFIGILPMFCKADATPPTPLVIQLPEDMPHVAGNEPSITCFPADPATANGAAALICPGGGYDHLAWGHEGVDVAHWLNQHGISGFVLKYRIKPFPVPAALHDAQNAMKLIRSRANEWHVDPQRLGIVGFSAGGHVASTLGTHCDADTRPAFMLLIYPVITMTDQLTHTGSRSVLMGEHPSDALIKEYSNELHVTDHTPPAFLLASTQDTIVPWQNSQLMADALSAHHVPVEFVKLNHGNHGFGLGGNDPVLNVWPEKALAWLRGIKMVP